ncbi:hypothetical protein RI367_004738 [Sorochytrium milnesiophthora]
MSPTVYLTRFLQWRYLNARTRRIHAEEEKEAQNELSDMRQYLVKLQQEYTETKLALDLEHTLVAIERQYGRQQKQSVEFRRLLDSLQSVSQDHAELSDALERTLSSVSLQAAKITDLESLTHQLKRVHATLSAATGPKDNTTEVIAEMERTTRSAIAVGAECTQHLSSLESLSKTQRTYLLERAVASWHDTNVL